MSERNIEIENRSELVSKISDAKSKSETERCRKEQARKLPELLAPVGGWQQLFAAVNNGADAVYLGGSLFNARMKAENFGGEKLKDAIDYAHERRVKVYITLNTLIKDRELSKAFDYAVTLYEADADALIVQDMGLARLVHKYIPDFPLHLSTQGTVYNPQALELVKELGFQRVVPARELTLIEIKEMCQRAKVLGLEIETFVHGALCMGYSGQCQMSRLLGDGTRSGNRGLCAQPCRLEYADELGNKSYTLSPKDICTIGSIPELCEAGVDSFKIEGRLKSAEYVATVTRIYRKYLDLYTEAIECGDERELLQIFNRGGFSTGYLYENPKAELLSGHSPKNQGILIGRVEGISKIQGAKSLPRRNSALSADGDIATARGSKVKRQNLESEHEERILIEVRLSEDESINLGDGVEIASAVRDTASEAAERTGNVVTYCEKIGKNLFRIGDFKQRGSSKKNKFNGAFGYSDSGQSSARRIKVGDAIYKVTDKALNDKALASCEDSVRKDYISMRFKGLIGELPTLELSDTTNSLRVTGESLVERAIKRPADEQRIREQLAKLGGTPFAVKNTETSTEVVMDEDAMIPVSVINSLRREAVRLLLEKRRASERQAISAEMIAEAKRDIEAGFTMSEPETNERIKLVPLEIFMRERSDAKARIYAKEVSEIQGLSDAKVISTAPKEIPYILNISKGNLDRYIEANFEKIVAAVNKAGLLLGNLAWIKQFLDKGIRVYGDYGLNVCNAQAARAFGEMGVEIMFMSDELSEDGKHLRSDNYRLKCGCESSEGRETCAKRKNSNMRKNGFEKARIQRVPKLMERVPLMITEHPLEGAYLSDRKGVKHTILKWYSGDKYLLF